MTRQFVLAVVGMLVVSASAHAQQSLYTANYINALRQNNSVGAFTTRQIQNQIVNRTVPQYGFSTANRDVFGGSPLGKPFRSAGGNGGGVSPWLALSQPFSSPTTNYYTQVRPQLDQQRANQQQAIRNEQMRRQLNSLAARGPFSATGNQNMAPTGHAAVYMNYGGYYQPVEPTKQR
jgi:hypothetical protein